MSSLLKTQPNPLPGTHAIHLGSEALSWLPQTEVALTARGAAGVAPGCVKPGAGCRWRMGWVGLSQVPGLQEGNSPCLMLQLLAHQKPLSDVGFWS